MSIKLTKSLIISLALCLFITQAPHAFAHVLIQDKTNTSGVIFHVTPDDDPIAGQASTLYFSQQHPSGSIKSASLTITNQSNSTSTRVSVQTANESLWAMYTFPTQGVYDLRLTVTTNRSAEYDYAQRVSRGTMEAVTAHPSFPLLVASLIIAGGVLAGTLAVAYNRRSAKRADPKV